MRGAGGQVRGEADRRARQGGDGPQEGELQCVKKATYLTLPIGVL